MKNSQIRKVEPSEFKFYKKAAAAPSGKAESNKTVNDCRVADVTLIATVPSESHQDSVAVDAACVTNEPATGNVQQISATHDEPVINYFHLKPSSNDFRFNFE